MTSQIVKKPKLAILTESLRRDNHAPLRFFTRVAVTHFYFQAPYQDMTKEEFIGSTQYFGMIDLYRKLLQLKPDIIQGSEPLASRQSLLISIVALLAAKRLQVPLIFPTLENRPLSDRLPRGVFAIFLRPLISWYFGYYARSASFILAVNNGAAANLRAAGIADTKVIHFIWGIWGVDRTVFKPTNKSTQVFFASPTILYAGRLEPEKGIRDTLAAFALVAGKYPAWQLALVGKGQLEAEIASFAKTNQLTDRIHLLEWVPSRELPVYFSAARVTVYPSVTIKRGDEGSLQGWSEQVGTVILQSLACGTPVVGTRSGAIPEYLDQDSGRLVSEHNPQELAQAIDEIMNDEALRKRLSRNGEQYIADQFDAQKNIQKAEDMVVSWVVSGKHL